LEEVYIEVQPNNRNTNGKDCGEMNWRKKKLCELTIEDVLQAYSEGYCFPVHDGKYVQFHEERTDKMERKSN
jgi:hypothetical protein